MNRKTRAAATAAMGVVLALEGCALVEWVNFNDRNVQQRIARHDGPWLVYDDSQAPLGANIDKNSRVSLTSEGLSFENGKRVRLTLVNPTLAPPPTRTPYESVEDYKQANAAELELSATLPWTTFPDTTEAACVAAARNRSTPPNLAGAYKSLCILVTVRPHPNNLDRDQLELRFLIMGRGAPATGGIVVGGPRPSMRYPIIYPEKAEPRPG